MAGFTLLALKKLLEEIMDGMSPDTRQSEVSSPIPVKSPLEWLANGQNVDGLHATMQSEMEEKSERLRAAVLACNPKELMGFLWGQLLLSQLHRGDDESEGAEGRAAIDDFMFALEYVHAVLSSHPAYDYGSAGAFEDVHAVLRLATELRGHSLFYGMVAAHRMPEGLLGAETGEVALQAITSWITIRGHRYQSLEEEFFRFVLAPHDDALRAAYGVGATEIAAGIQAAVDATRFGHMRAAETLAREADAAFELVEREGMELAQAIDRIVGEDPTRREAAEGAIASMVFGGICNLSKTSGLPAELLSDLSYSPGEEKEFFASGPLCGTPLRRMPGRVKPLVRLDDGYYTCDANFIRDSTYRSLQWGLLNRLPTYKQEWLKRQTSLTEEAFSQIFASQLAGADVLTSIYYPDPDTGKWVENDVLIILDDVLLQVEVKAGVMPMHSPELNFDRHVRTIQDLVVKAHHQCERFLRYAASAEEVPIYRLVDGMHQELKRLRLADYRVVLPIGLTVEAFTPFSAMSKRLDDVRPILGRYPFISMSIDDLFVLKRFLPTTGELMHYLSVRQRVAGIREAVIFDELDHLGSYVTQNRVDRFFAEMLAQGADMLVAADVCAPIDDYFADPDWETHKPPHQSYPRLLQELLQSIDRVRGRTFLSADNIVRDMSAEGRTDMARAMEQLIPTLREHPYRWVTLMLDEPLLIWLQRSGYVDVQEVHRDKAESVAIFSGSQSCTVLFIQVSPRGSFDGAWTKRVSPPDEGAPRYAARLADAQRMGGRAVALTSQGLEVVTQARRNI
ncbi:hypothetical protein [Ralstonia wenshanensis]|uniref:hypothetical protein n=1 Tax=Ralstonia wenshanensis TaxID=2842456 RepID=UPI002930E041|nr:hypothetical protein [Ralstonia wenshanensis]